MALKRADNSITISSPKVYPEKITFDPGGSKSISNRVLLIAALSEGKINIDGLSGSADTVIMGQLLRQKASVYDASDAGTCFRFMTSYLALQVGEKVLTGSDRMKQRPIAPLVTALNSIGCKISYLGERGFPPLKIGPFDRKRYHNEVAIRGDISSQFISSLMMIAPLLPEGLRIKIQEPVLSLPYLKMTENLMREFGIDIELNDMEYLIPHGHYSHNDMVRVEPDWSSASYAIGLMALLRTGEVFIKGLQRESWQGDKVIMDIGSHWGLTFDFENNGLKVKAKRPPEKAPLIWDFSNCPDLAPTVMAVNAALGIDGNYSGVSSLRIKESDRIKAMQENLEKAGVKLTAIDSPESLGVTLEQTGKIDPFDTIEIQTFGDHRIAMSCGLWGVLGKIYIDDAGVVGKSYPDFWKDLASAGLVINQQD